jgi:hypothetical protein
MDSLANETILAIAEYLRADDVEFARDEAPCLTTLHSFSSISRKIRDITGPIIFDEVMLDSTSFPGLAALVCEHGSSLPRFFDSIFWMVDVTRSNRIQVEAVLRKANKITRLRFMNVTITHHLAVSFHWDKVDYISFMFSHRIDMALARVVKPLSQISILECTSALRNSFPLISVSKIAVWNRDGKNSLALIFQRIRWSSVKDLSVCGTFDDHLYFLATPGHCARLRSLCVAGNGHSG